MVPLVELFEELFEVLGNISLIAFCSDAMSTCFRLPKGQLLFAGVVDDNVTRVCSGGGLLASAFVAVKDLVGAGDPSVNSC